MKVVVALIKNITKMLRAVRRHQSVQVFSDKPQPQLGSGYAVLDVAVTTGPTAQAYRLAQTLQGQQPMLEQVLSI